MIKDLSRYVIPAIFDDELINWQLVDLTEISDDFYSLIQKLDLPVNLSDDYDWQEKKETINLQVDLVDDFRDCIGDFFITWDSNGKYSHIWFAGYDDEGEYKSWKWK